jgi:GntR family transcriptional repressor for pyruvate dehydrogenase complex
MTSRADATQIGLFTAGVRERRLGAAEDAIATIKSMIVEGKLKPHQRMPSEQELAAALGVSRPTLREATRALVALNILEVKHGDGTFVTSLDPELLAQPIDFLLCLDKENFGVLIETREVLETAIAGLAAVRATEADVARLQGTVEEYSKSLSRVSQCILLDQRFHMELAEAARSPILASMLSTMSMLAAKSRQTTARSAAVRQRSDNDHRAILAAVVAKDAGRARTAMGAHLHHVVPAKLRRS